MQRLAGPPACAPCAPSHRAGGGAGGGGEGPEGGEAVGVGRDDGVAAALSLRPDLHRVGPGEKARPRRVLLRPRRQARGPDSRRLHSRRNGGDSIAAGGRVAGPEESATLAESRPEGRI